MLNLEGKLQNSVLLRKYTRTDKESADSLKSACREGNQKKNNKKTFVGGMVFHWRKLQRGYYFILCENEIVMREKLFNVYGKIYNICEK